MAQEWTPPDSPGSHDKVPNYLVPAILSAVCCFPLGIISIIFAAQVNGKVAAGDVTGALDSSKKAKMFSYIFLGLGILVWGGYLLLVFLGVGLSFMGNM